MTRSLSLALLAVVLLVIGCDEPSSSTSTGNDSAATGTCEGCPMVTKENVCRSTPTCRWVPTDGSTGADAGTAADGGTATGYCDGCPNVTKEVVCKLTPTCTWVPYP